MPCDAEITFADHAARHYARRYGMAPMVGRLIGYLMICEPRKQTIGELAEALLASRSAITGAVKSLEQLGLLSRTRPAGERMDRVSLDRTSRKAFGFETEEYEEMSALAHEGLGLLSDASLERRAVLLEVAAFADWLISRLPEWDKDWTAHREELRQGGKLPDLTSD